MMTPLDPYVAVPFEPEPIESMLVRFPAALRQIPVPPTRQFVFDFDSNIRMIASLERMEGVAVYIHLSFGVPPWNKTIHSDSDLQRIARELAVKFVGLKEPDEKMQTVKAYHLFYLQ